MDARLPGLPVLIFDGDCGFCSSAVRFAGRRIYPGLRARPYQEADLDALGVSRQRAAREVLWADASGQVWGGAQAVARLLASAGGWWTVPGALIRVPPLSWLAAAGYRLVAASRHRLPGGTPACAVSARPASPSDNGGS